MKYNSKFSVPRIVSYNIFRLQRSFLLLNYIHLKFPKVHRIFSEFRYDQKWFEYDLCNNKEKEFFDFDREKRMLINIAAPEMAGFPDETKLWIQFYLWKFFYENSFRSSLFQREWKKEDSCLVYDNQTRVKFSLFVKSLFYILLFIHSFILFSRFDSNVEKTRLKERKKFHRYGKY